MYEARFCLHAVRNLLLGAMLTSTAWAHEPSIELADGLPPESAAKRMTVPPGFQVQLAAGEPQIHQPIGFAIDHRGRLWVAEAYTYPNRAAEGKGRDKIVILEDTDGNGTLDSRKVFIEGLNLVSGLEVGFGGVWVGAAPYLMFIPDRDGDDRPDRPARARQAPPIAFPKDVPPGADVLLDGFGWHDTHETLNSFLWGPDGWLYGCHGVFTHSKVGPPGTPDDEREPLNAGVWRYHPTRHQFEVFAWGTSNPWGVDFDDNGQAFVTACVIPHLFHIIPGARYQRQAGQHFAAHVYADIPTIADHRHYVGNIRDHAWWGHEPHAPADTLAAGGGHAHCGAMVYLGDNWPAEYRNRIYMNNIHGNRINCDVLERHGSGFVGRHGKDLLIANDRWYRGINLKYGPDGSVYLIDWYDKNACHRTNPEIWDRTNGRIYNIAHGKLERVNVDLSRKSDTELVKLHLHANDWYVRTARRILQERATAREIAPEALNALRDILNSHPDATRQLRGLWTLHALGRVASDDLLVLLNSNEPSVRGWAVRLEAEDHEFGPGEDAHRRWLHKLRELATTDPSPAVRLEIAAALQRIPLADRWDIADALLSHAEDAEDHNLPLMNWYAVEPLVAADPARAIELAKKTEIPLLRQFIVRRAASENELLPHAVAWLNEADDATREMILGEMLNAFEGRVNIPMPKEWEAAYETLSKSESGTIREQADRVAVTLGDRRIFPRMRQVLTDTTAKPDERKRALDILVRGRDADAVSALQQVLDEAALRGPALRALASFDDPRTPAAVLKHYADFTATERQDAIGTLAARPQSALALLDAMESGRVPRTDLHAYHVRQLLGFENERLDARLREVWGEFRETSADKQQQIAAYKKLLTPKFLKTADPSRGRQLFAKTCANCHKLFGEGGTVGPDITGSNRANLDYILGNVVDPSAVLGKDYRMTVIATADGRVVSGLLQKETDSALTLQTLNDTVVVPKDDIAARKLSNLSMMPEKLLDQLQPEEIRDLIAYLSSPSQVPLRGPQAPIDMKTGRVPGALEGESLKIIGKSEGSARSQNMSGFPKDRWSGGSHLWWTGAKPGARLELEIPVESDGRYRPEIVLTMARDYGIVQLRWDDERLGPPLNLYNSPDVVTTGVLDFEPRNVSAGTHRLSLEVVGAHPQAVKAYMVGLDYIRLVPAE